MTVKNSEPVNPDDLLTLKECHAICRLSLSSLYDACSNNILPHYRLSGTGKAGKVMVRRRDLLAWIESNRIDVGEVTDEDDLKYL